MKRIFFALFCVLFLLTPANASMTVSPTKFKFDVKKNQKYITGSIDLSSDNTSKAVRFKTYSGYFELSELGYLIFNFKPSDKKKSVSDFLINPKELTLSPNSKQTIRFTIPDVDKLPDGESRVIAFIEDIKTKEDILPSPGQGISASVTIRQRIGIPIYIDKGQVIKTGQIDSLTLNKAKQYELAISSKGNSSIRVTGVVQLFSNNKLVKESKFYDLPILSGSRRIITDKMDISLLEQKNNLKLKTKLYYKNANNKKIILTKEVSLDKG